MANIERRFFSNGNIVQIKDIDQSAVANTLPVKMYTIQQNAEIGLHLVATDDKMQPPTKVYGEMLERADRIIKTYNDRNVSTGVLLTGEKGSGKTLLSTIVASKMLKLNVPVVIISDPFHGTAFIEFINSLGNCMLIFDEYAKVYGKSNREDANVTESTILTILDGTNKQKRLAVLIENRKWDVSEYIINRPGRIWYHFEYDKLSTEVITDYCASMKIPSEIVKDMMLIRSNIRTFNFDMMKALIEEYKRYGGSIIDHAKVLNISFDTEKSKYNIIKMVHNASDKEVKPDRQVIEIDSRNHFELYIAKEQIAVKMKEPTGVESVDVQLAKLEASYLAHLDGDEDEDETYVCFTEANRRLDERGTVIYDNGDYTIVLRKQEFRMRNYNSFMY